MCIYCLLRKQKCRLKTTTTNGWRHFGQSEQCKSSVLFPIQSEIVQILAFLHVNCERIVSCPPPKNRLQSLRESMITGLPLLCFDYQSTDSTCACIYVPKIWIANKLPNCILQIVPIVLYFRCTHRLLIQILGFVNWVNCILQIAPIMSYLRRISCL